MRISRKQLDNVLKAFRGTLLGLCCCRVQNGKLGLRLAVRVIRWDSCNAGPGLIVVTVNGRCLLQLERVLNEGFYKILVRFLDMFDNFSVGACAGWSIRATGTSAPCTLLATNGMFGLTALYS